MRLTSRSIGFSQNIAFFARAARSMRSAWVSVGEQMATASTWFEPRISSTDAVFAPVAAASAMAAAGSASATKATWQSRRAATLPP